MAKMTKCKSCGAEIAKSAKACPQCGAKQKKPVALIAILVIVIIGIIAAASGGGSGSPAKVGDTGSPAASAAPENSAFHVGDVVEMKNIQVTLVNVTESTGANYMTPDEGKVFVLCEFNIENNSGSDISVSSLMSFEAYVDDYSTNMSLTATMSSDKSQLDGTVAAGKKMNGVIGYEADKDWKTLEVRFTPNFWTGKDIVFEYSK